MHGNVSKHVTMVTEMSRIVEERKLMLVSQTEQELACNSGQAAAFEVFYMFISQCLSCYKSYRLHCVLIYKGCSFPFIVY